MLKRTKMTEQVVSERWKFWKKKVEKQELEERWQKDEKLEKQFQISSSKDSYGKMKTKNIKHFQMQQSL